MKMRQPNWAKFAIILVALISIAAFALSTFGQEDDSASGAATGTSRTVSLRDFGYGDVSVFAPENMATYFIRIPAEWRVVRPLTVDLQVQAFISGTSNTNFVGGEQSAIIEVQYNSNPVHFEAIGTNTEHHIDFTIDDDAERVLASPLTSGTHIIQVTLHTNLPCDGPVQVGMVIDADSTITFNYESQAISTDLSQLPAPIYQNSFELNTATLVVPDNPYEAELSSLFSVIAGLGRDTSSTHFDYAITTESLLTDEQRTNTHLIYVGEAYRFSTLAALPLIAYGQTTDLSIQADDGIVEMLVSPWNSAKVLLSVSGNTDTAIMKAAQAVSSNSIRTTGPSNVAIVSDVRTSVETTTTPVDVDQTWGNAGYGLVSLIGTAQQTTYNLYLDPATFPTSDYQLHLSYSHSSIINYEQSTVEVLVNTARVASLRLSDDTSDGEVAIIDIPHSQLLPGNNAITITSRLLPLDLCLDPNSTSLWVNIFPESFVSRIDNPNPAGAGTHFISLTNYPYPYLLNTGLNDVTFVVPENVPEAWNQAARVMYDLGERADGTVMSPRVSFGSAADEELLANSNVIVVGQPKDIPYIAELGSVLPAAFDAGSNIAREENFELAYRLSPDKTLGYLQIIDSPTAEGHAVLSILGTNDDAVRQAVDAMLDPRLARFRQGIVQLVENQRLIPVQVAVEDTGAVAAQPTIVPTVDVQATAEVNEPSTLNVEPINPRFNEFQAPRPTWVITVVFYSTFILLGIFLFVFFSQIVAWIKRVLGR